jgi:hypothetical protein
MREPQPQQPHARRLADQHEREHRDRGEGDEAPVAREVRRGEQPGHERGADGVDEEGGDPRLEGRERARTVGRQPQRGATYALLRGWR